MNHGSKKDFSDGLNTKLNYAAPNYQGIFYKHFSNL